MCRLPPRLPCLLPVRETEVSRAEDIFCPFSAGTQPMSSVAAGGTSGPIPAAATGKAVLPPAPFLCERLRSTTLRGRGRAWEEETPGTLDLISHGRGADGHPAWALYVSLWSCGSWWICEGSVLFISASLPPPRSTDIRTPTLRLHRLMKCAPRSRAPWTQRNTSFPLPRARGAQAARRQPRACH